MFVIIVQLINAVVNFMQTQIGMDTILCNINVYIYKKRISTTWAIHTSNNIVFLVHVVT